MRNSARLAIGVVGVSALMGTLVSPASADTAVVTAEVADNGIAISAPTDIQLGVLTPGKSSTATTDVAVTDNRASEAGWTASVSMTDLTAVDATGGTVYKADGTTPVTIGASVATYTASAVAAGVGETASPVSSGSKNLADSVTTTPGVVTATATGNNSATWLGTVKLDTPKSALKGNYTGKLTHSVA